MINSVKISFDETLRYLGNTSATVDKSMENLMKECEKELLSVITPRYLYKIIPMDEALLQGESIKKHLANCSKVAVMCATIGAGVDKLIRYTQVADMAKAVIIDAMASVAIEDVCNKVEELIAEEVKGYYTTWRFSPGYGDYPINLQKDFLNILDAQKKIGLCTNDSFLLTPSKSVTAIIGISDTPVDNKRKGCYGCNLAKTCKYRKAGTRCGF